MVSSTILATITLLATTAAASPRWWTSIRSKRKSLQARHNDGPQAGHGRNARVHTIPSGAFVSNGVLYVQTTVTLAPGVPPPPMTTITVPSATQSAPAPVTVTMPPSSQAPASPPAQVVSQAPAVQPAPQLSTFQTVQQPASSKAASVAPAPLASFVSAPAPASKPVDSDASGNSLFTSQKIVAVAPLSGSCAGRGPQCATADQAAFALGASFAKYGINTPGAQAAIIALVALESVEFQFNTNQYPGRPGQGTRAMLMPDNVASYATATYGAAKVAAAGSVTAILDLVNGNDSDSFGSAAWYMKAKCPELITQFQGATLNTAWNTYIVSCVSTTMSADRTRYWEAAKKAASLS